MGKGRLGRWGRWAMLGGATLATALGMAQTSAMAQSFPSRQARVIVPFPAGGAVDVVARIIAAGMAAQSGHPVIVENKPGANSLLAVETVMRSQADGHTLLFSSDDTFTIVPQLTANLTYDPTKELVPVILVGRILMVMVVNASVPVNSLPALIARARANPGSLSYSSHGSGSSTHLEMELLKSLAKIDILHVPYKGVAPALTAAAAGEVQVTITGYGTARGLIEDGKLRPIAIASPERVAALPNVPTTGESGYGNVDATTLLGFFVPAKTPPEIINRIKESVARALTSPDTRKQVEARYIVVTDVGPKAYAEELAARSRLHAEAIRVSGAKAE